MKIYVDEFPKKCLDCPCRDFAGGCNLNKHYPTNKEDCPLQLLPKDDKDTNVPNNL